MNLIFFNSSADAGLITLHFSNISGNSVVDAAAGELQLSVIVTDDATVTPLPALGDPDPNVRFIFLNIGSESMSITNVYFDDGSLLAIATIIDSDDGAGGDSGVDFSSGSSPPNLPSANSVSPSFVATTDFSADSDPAVQPNGVNPGEFLAIDYSLQSGQTFADVISELGDGSLRIGLKVQGFDGDGSESFVNDPPNGGGGGGLIPEPSSLVLAGIGVLGLFGYGRKRKKNPVTA